jgi:TonB family protein
VDGPGRLYHFLTAVALAAVIAPFTFSANSAAAQSAEPTLVHSVPPQYPARALQRGRSGDVTLRFTIDVNGATKDIEVVESSSSVFEDAAVKALSQWRYAPLTENGKAVERRGVQTIIRFGQGR